MLLDLVPDLLVNNGFLFTGINLVFIFDFADIGMIAQEPVYVGAIPNAAVLPQLFCFVQFCAYQFRRSGFQKPVT